MNAKYSFQKDQQYLFHGDGKTWRKGRITTPEYAILCKVEQSTSGGVLKKRTRFSNVKASSIALLNEAGSDEVELLYRSHDDIHESLKVFPEEGSSRWGKFGYPMPAFVWQLDKPHLAAFYKPGKLGIEQEDSTVIWHRVEPVKNPAHQSIIDDFLNNNPRKDRIVCDNLQAIEGGYLIYFNREKSVFFVSDATIK